MRKRIIPLIFAFSFFFFISSITENLYAEKLRIFCIQSYKKDFGCGARIEDGMINYLQNSKYKKIEFSHYYLKSMSINRSKPGIEAEARKAIKEIENINPDIVVLFDDVACKTLIPKLVNTKYPVVFAGMNLSPEIYNERFKFMEKREKPGFNITGVTEEVDFIKALKVVKEIVPEYRNMVIISSSGMEFIPEVLENLKENIKKDKEKYPFNLLKTIYVNTFDDFKNIVLKYDNDKETDIIFIFTLIALTDKQGKTVSVKKGIEWVVNNQKKPGISWMNDWIRLGHLGGACVDLYKCGDQVGKMIEKILNGEKPGNIPIEKPDHHFIALNKERADKLGLKIPVHLLEGAKILYEKIEAVK